MTVRGTRMAAAGVVLVAGLVTCGTVLGAGIGNAAPSPVDKTLTFTCSFPMIGDQQLSVKIHAVVDTPPAVGGDLKTSDFSSTVTVPATATQGLHVVGATTVEGTAEASVVLD